MVNTNVTYRENPFFAIKKEFRSRGYFLCRPNGVTSETVDSLNFGILKDAPPPSDKTLLWITENVCRQLRTHICNIEIPDEKICTETFSGKSIYPIKVRVYGREYAKEIVDIFDPYFFKLSPDAPQDSCLFCYTISTFLGGKPVYVY